MTFNFVKYRKVYYVFSGILVLASLLSLIFFRLNFGIDFTGGSILEAEFTKERISNEALDKKLADLNLGAYDLQPTGDKGIIIRMRSIDEDTHQKILERLKGEVEEKSFESIGPVVGKELRQKTWIFTFLVVIAIVSYIALAFRKASRPISSLQYGLVAAFVAFFHDIFIPIGVFSFLGKFYGVQVTIPIVVGLLTIFGYSVHDTIVIFDRIRENLFRNKDFRFEQIINNSLNQTLGRSINTSATTLLVLFSILFFGGATIKYFSLILILGISAGTYSSIFLAAPILVSWTNWRKKK